MEHQNRKSKRILNVKIYYVTPSSDYTRARTPGSKANPPLQLKFVRI